MDISDTDEGEPMVENAEMVIKILATRTILYAVSFYKASRSARREMRKSISSVRGD